MIFILGFVLVSLIFILIHIAIDSERVASRSATLQHIENLIAIDYQKHLGFLK